MSFRHWPCSLFQLPKRIHTKYSAQAVKTKPNNIPFLYNPQENITNIYEFHQFKKKKRKDEL
jgi:hypothetical protein